MLKRTITDKVFSFIIFKNKFVEKVVMVEGRENYDRAMQRNEELGFEVKEIYETPVLTDFLLYGLHYIDSKCLDRDNNPPTCSTLSACGLYARDIMDFMSEYDIDWQDLDKDGELYICLSIFADNQKKCILMNGE